MKTKLFSLAVIVVFTSLTITTMAKGFKEVKKPPVDENFETFYSKFYSDAAFQQSRIYWPLDGGMHQISFGPDGKTTTTKWVKGNKITYLNLETPKASYDKENKIAPSTATRTIELKDGIYIETFASQGCGCSIIYHYKLIDNKWYLVYYDFTAAP